MKYTIIKAGLLFATGGVLAAVGLHFFGGGMSNHERLLTAPWMALVDTDRDGRISVSEYARVDDGKTPLKVLDLNNDRFIDNAELAIFMAEADPVRWIGR
jgi:hypothetical protein